MSSSFWDRARHAPDRIAVVEPSGAILRAGDLLASADRLAHALRARGLGPGDGVAFCLPNRGALLEVYLAVMQVGLYLVPLHTKLRDTEIAHVLADAAVGLVLCDASTEGTVRRAAALAGMASDACVSVDDPSYAAWKAAQPEGPPADRRGGVLTLYTSGTTGKPKGVKRPLRPGAPEATLASEYYLGLFGLRPGEGVHLVCSPLHHGAALNWCTDHLHLGHTVVLVDKWTPEAMLALVARWRVSASLMVPTHLRRLLALSDEARARHDLSSLRFVVHTGAPCAVEVKRRMLAWWGPVIWEIYAASEGAATLVSPEEWLARPGTVGKPFPFSRVRVLDDAGADCAPGVPGRVFIRQGGASFSYHADAAKTAAARHEGFFTVGDIGYLDEAGYLFLCDRASDVIVSGGVNVYPSEIEAALGTHPAVADVAVIGAPDEEWGEVVKAFVELRPGFAPTAELEAELIAHARERIAAFKCPRLVELGGALPRDDNGKLRRRELRDAAWAGRDRAI